MHRLQVQAQLTLQREGRVAVAAGIGGLAVRGLAVAQQAGRVGIAFAAAAAAVGPLARVQALVPLEVRAAAEGCAAVLACEGPLVAMYHAMAQEGDTGAKLLAADITRSGTLRRALVGVRFHFG